MNNVIGPINQVDWNTLVMLRKSINYYLDHYDPKYDVALNKTKTLYKELLEEAA